MPGMGELLIILAIVLVVFGARKLPAVGDALGRTLKNFKRGVAGDDELEVGPGAGGRLASGAAPDRDA
jgi:sec-independent protein translocase protein TatA